MIIFLLFFHNLSILVPLPNLARGVLDMVAGQVNLHLDPLAVLLRVPGVRDKEGMDAQHLLLVVFAQRCNVEAGVDVQVEVRRRYRRDDESIRTLQIMGLIT